MQPLNAVQISFKSYFKPLFHKDTYINHQVVLMLFVLEVNENRINARMGIAGTQE